MEGLKDLLAPKTLHWFSYAANVCWILLGIILSAIFLDTENSEPRFDFHCSSMATRNSFVESVTNSMKNCTTNSVKIGV